MFTIETRDVPAQTVLTEQRVVIAPDLPAYIEETMARLWAIAESVGGVTGPAFFIYHDEITDEHAGPMEMCLPIDPARASETPAPTRIEPAHREAYTRIPKHLVEFPQILTAYEAVEGWLAETGTQMTDSPREVYFTDYMAAGPDDLVCDIAFPIATNQED